MLTALVRGRPERLIEVDVSAVEFVDEPAPPPPTRQRTPLAVVLAIAAAVVALAFAVTLGREHPLAAPRPSVPAPSVPAPTPSVPAVPGPNAWPSALLNAAFAAHLPGAVLTDEATVLNLDHPHGIATFAFRDLRAVYGNVKIKLQIVPVDSALVKAPALRLRHGGYAFDFSFNGGALPPGGVRLLRGLVADARLVALGA